MGGGLERWRDEWVEGWRNEDMSSGANDLECIDHEVER